MRASVGSQKGNCLSAKDPILRWNTVWIYAANWDSAQDDVKTTWVMLKSAKATKLMGILVHLDVVPAGPGWTVEPFDATIKGDRIYGRGVIDDKGPAIAAIYAMKELADSGKPLGKRVRIIFGCSEETGE